MVATRRKRRPEPPEGVGVAAGGYPTVPRARSLACRAPDLVAVCWEPLLNGPADPTELAPSSDRLAWWRCPNYAVCGAVSLTPIRSKHASYRAARGIRECRQCAARARTPPTVTLAQHVPAATLALVPTVENRLGAHQLSSWHTALLTWRCMDDSSHPTYQAVIPRCEGRLPTCPTCNSLAVRRPDLAAEWHPDRNDKTPDQVDYGARYKAWWLCERGHPWEAVVGIRATQDTGCSKCSLAHSSRTEIRLWAELTALFDPLLRENGAATESTRRHTGVWHQIQVLPRPAGPADILLILPAAEPGMAARQVVMEYDSWYRHESRRAEDLEKTTALLDTGCDVIRLRETPLECFSENTVTVPADPSPFENAAAALQELLHRGHLTGQLEKAAHRYLNEKQAIGTRLANARLNARALPDLGPDSLAVQFPELAAEWDVETNGDLTPRQVRPDYSRSTWWICPLGDHYDLSPGNRIRGRNCPYCANKRVNGRNALATTHPQLAAEWHPENAKRPTEVTAGYHGRVRWLCSNRMCGNVWITAVKNRTRNSSGCPDCWDRRRRSASG